MSAGRSVLPDGTCRANRNSLIIRIVLEVQSAVDKDHSRAIDNLDFHACRMSMDHPLPLQPQTPGKIRPASRAPWRSYFHDHPMILVDKIQAHSSGKPKVYCKACFSAHLQQLIHQDNEEHMNGARVEVRSHSVIAAYRTSAPI